MDMKLDRDRARTEAAHRDRQRLQGTWNFLAGKREAQLLVVGEHYTLIFKNGEIYKGTLILDPTHHPREMDLVVEEGPQYQGLTTQAIYEIDGDHLIWSPARPGSTDRPRIFPSHETAGQLCIVFRREKPRV
jgi:uncharacterized protein (TIGR03067 family)